MKFFHLLISIVATAVAKEDLPADAKLQIGIKQAGDCSKKAENGDSLKLHYEGRLRTTGEEFDSSRKRDAPLPVVLGAGSVIPGWEQGVLGMCLNEKRKLIIPSGLAYGDNGAPPKIPPGATLEFDIELVDLIKSSAKEKEL